MPRSRVLTLDLAGVVGWAFGDIGADAWPVFGSWVLPKIGGRGARYVAFEDELEETLGALRPDLVLMESPLPVQAMNGQDAAEQQLALKGYVEGCCCRFSVSVEAIDAYTVRYEVFGSGRFPKGETKPAVLAWCVARGLRVPDHNAGDAVLLWEWRRRAHRRAVA